MNKCQLLIAWVLIILFGTAALTPQQQVSPDLDYQIYLPLVARTTAGPTLLYFRANVAIADPGDTIQLEWASLGAATAELWRLAPGGPIAEWWPVAPSGVFTYTIGLSQRNFVHFSLFVTADDGASAGESLLLPLTCPDTWFFAPGPTECPGAPPLYSAGAEQPFVNGVMVWVAEQSYIYVLFADDLTSPRWMIYPDTWEEGDTLCDPGAVPPGYYQPQRGFGKVWCEQATVRDRLGWATALETGYETAVQRDSAPKYSTVYLRAADGNVWKLWPEHSGWEKLIQP